MKTFQKLMALAVIAGGMAFVSGADTAEAGHRRFRSHHSHRNFHHRGHHFKRHFHNHYRFKHHYQPVIKQAFVAPTYYHGYKVLCDAHGCYYYFDNYGVKHILPLR